MADEPQPEGDDWLEYGGRLIWAAGFTEGGAPYGVTVDEFREMNERCDGRAGWAQAKQALRQVLRRIHGKVSDDSIGWVRFLGEGLSYRVYCADCQLGRKEQRLVVRLPKANASYDPNEQSRREIFILRYLSTLNFPVRLPKIIGSFPVSHGLALVQEWIEGTPLETRAPRNPHFRPWEIIAQAAGLCHQVDPGPLREALAGYPTRRHHALAMLRVFEDLDIPESARAMDWVRQNLPPDNPCSLVHGDLLGQNLFVGFGDATLCILDWGLALIGDPAYDLAIVTRGRRRPFQVEYGLEKLLEAYNARAKSPLTPANVRLYELCLVAGFYKQHSREFGRGSAHAENTRTHLRNFIERLERGLSKAKPQ